MKAKQSLLLTSILIPALSQLASPASMSLSAAGQPLKPQSVAFIGVNVVPMDQQRVLAAQTVVIKDIRNTTKCAGVMIGGCWLPQTELQLMLKKLAVR